jgi:thiol-disulfide isomerase/thioredoxin
MVAMSDDKELESILDRIVRRLRSQKKDEAKPAEARAVKHINAKVPHGVYRFNREAGVWEPLPEDGKPLALSEDGVYVVYFGNTKCPACRVYDTIWNLYIDTVGRNLEGVTHYAVICGWFAGECSSEKAALSFKQFDVRASPTTLVVRVSGGSSVSMERLEGVVPQTKIVEAINKVRGTPSIGV